eukprot:1181500-Prorocentrum_minimum.AAC.7
MTPLSVQRRGGGHTSSSPASAATSASRSRTCPPRQPPRQPPRTSSTSRNPPARPSLLLRPDPSEPRRRSQAQRRRARSPR